MFSQIKAALNIYDKIIRIAKVDAWPTAQVSTQFLEANSVGIITVGKNIPEP